MPPLTLSPSAVLCAAAVAFGPATSAKAQATQSPLYTELSNRQRTVLKETVKDWTLQCYTLMGNLASDRPHGCMIYSVREIGGNFVALQVDGIYPDRDSIIMRFATSLQVSPDTPVVVDFGVGLGEFRFVEKEAGVSEVEFAEGQAMVIGAMKGGDSIRFRLTQKNGNVIDERISLAGFSATWKAYQEKLQRPDDFPPIDGYAELFGPARTAEEVRALFECIGATDEAQFTAYCEPVLGFEGFTPAERGAVLAMSFFADRPSAGSDPEQYTEEVRSLVMRALELDPYNYPLAALRYYYELNTESFVGLTAAQMFSTPEQGMAQIRMGALFTDLVEKKLGYVTGAVTFKAMCADAQAVAADYAGGWAEAAKVHPVVAFTELEDHDEATCAALLAEDTAPAAPAEAAPTTPSNAADDAGDDSLSPEDAQTLTKALSDILAANPAAKGDLALAEVALAFSAAYRGTNATEQSAAWADLRAAIDERDWLLAEVQKLDLRAYRALSAEGLQAMIALQRAVLLTYAAGNLADERSPKWQTLLAWAKTNGASSDVRLLQDVNWALAREITALGLDMEYDTQAMQACDAGTSALCP